jgi:F0F1-type ATP synthase membrane subunit b/b'
LQLAAFYGSGKDRKPVWDDVWGWLTKASTTRVLLNSASNASSLSQQIKALSALSSHQLAFLEREAEEILGWLTRLTEAKYKEEERSAGNRRSRTKESASGETSGGEEGAEYD